jgi:hypothetical protein
VGITFDHLAFSYRIDNLDFKTEGKTCCYIHQTLLLGFSNWPVIYYTQSSFLASSSPRHQRACNPGIAPRCGDVLGRSAMSTVLPLAVVATGQWLHRHNRGCADGVTAMVFLLAPLRAHL